MAGKNASISRACTGSKPSAPATAVATPSARSWASAASGGVRFTVSEVGNGTGTMRTGLPPPRAARRAAAAASATSSDTVASAEWPQKPRGATRKSIRFSSASP
jgi:hypothetical protein